jgi:hypothetical protein
MIDDPEGNLASSAMVPRHSTTVPTVARISIVCNGKAEGVWVGRRSAVVASPTLTRYRILFLEGFAPWTIRPRLPSSSPKIYGCICACANGSFSVRPEKSSHFLIAIHRWWDSLVPRYPRAASTTHLIITFLRSNTLDEFLGVLTD